MNPKPLSETDFYVLFKEYEDTFLFEKDANNEVWRINLYGEATCGLISLSNEWVIIGGEKLIVWENRELKLIEDQELEWIHDLRQVAENEVEILTDPWKENSAIWLFNIYSKKKLKIRDFNNYKFKIYTENVDW